MVATLPEKPQINPEVEVVAKNSATDSIKLLLDKMLFTTIEFIT